MPVYRYRLDSYALDDLQRGVGGAALVLGSQSPLYQDVTAQTGQLTDLSHAMAARGWTLVATDPVTTPTAQASSELGGGSSFDIRDQVVFDHFVTGNPGDTDEFGSAGWRTATAGTGSAVTQTAEAGRPGIARMEAGTTAAAYAAIYLGDAVVPPGFVLTTAQNQINCEWLVKLSGSLLATDLEIFQCGWGTEWAAVGQLLNGVYFRFLPGTDTNWTVVNANGGTRTTVATSTAVALNTWYRLGIRITFPGGVATVQPLVNGATQGAPITANMPAAAVGFGAKIDSFGSVVTEPVALIDYVTVTQVTAKET